MELKDKVALVTGAARRVGRTIAAHFAERGAIVAVHYNRSRAEAESFAAEIERTGGRARAFAANLESQRAPADVDVPVTKWGEPERAVGTGILLVTDPDQRGLQELYERRQDPFARQPWFPQVLGYPPAYARQAASKLQHTVEFGRIPVGSPVRVITVLFAAPGVAPGRLQVPLGIGADPHITIGGWDGKTADSCQQSRVRHLAATRMEVREIAPTAHPPDAGVAITREFEID